MRTLYSKEAGILRNVLGVIPARGGSKSIPGKNITLLLGRPLIAYTCESAIASKLMSRVIVSTDDKNIAEVAEKCGVEAPFLRSEALSQDDTPSLPVIQHSVEWLAENEGYRADAVMILQPTSPLRKPCHIDGAIEAMNKTNADTVVSVIEAPHRYNPVSLMSMTDNGGLKPYAEGPMILRRQDKPVVYARNGPAVLLVRTSTLMEQDTLYGDNVQPYFMSELESFDVDGPDDLVIIEALMKHIGSF